MREKMIPLTTMLTAGAATSIVCIWKGFDTLYSLKVLLAVLIGFYILGTIAKKLLHKIMAQPPAEEGLPEELEGEEEEKETGDGEPDKT